MECNRGNINRRRRGYALAALFLSLAFFFFSFPVYAEEDYAVTEIEMEGTVNTSSSLNIRSGPGTSYSVISKADKGTVLAITGETEADGATWYQVEADGKTGYALSDYISASAPPAGAEKPEEQEELEPEAGEPEGGYRGFYQKPVFLKSVAIALVIVLVLVMLVFTLKGLKKDQGGYDDGDDEDEYDSDAYGEEYDDADGYADYDDGSGEADEYEAYAAGDADVYDDGDTDAYDDGDYADADYDDGGFEEEEYEESGYDGGIRREAGAGNGDGSYAGTVKRNSGRKAYILREEDYRVQIDPSFFEDKEPIEQPAMVTGYLEKKLIEEAARAHEVELRDEELQQAGGDPEDKQRELDQAMAKLNELQKEIERLKSQK